MKQNKLIFAIGSLFLFLLDRLIKNVALYNPSQTDGLFFYFQPTLNNHGPFSLTLPNLILFIFSAAALVWLTHLTWRSWLKNELVIFLGASLMLVGGYSNFWDRIIRGGVIDIWHLSFGAEGLNFNLADVYLIIGLLVIILVYKKRRVTLSI